MDVTTWWIAKGFCDDCDSSEFFVGQYHKPSMTGNDEKTIPIYGEIEDGLWLLYPHYIR